MFSPKKQTWPRASGAFFLDVLSWRARHRGFDPFCPSRSDGFDARPGAGPSRKGRQPGSNPVFRFAGAVAGEARNFTSAAAAASPAPAALASPAEIAVVSWMSAGSGPTSISAAFAAAAIAAHAMPSAANASHFRSRAHDSLTFPPATRTLIPPDTFRHQVTFGPCEERAGTEV